MLKFNVFFQLILVLTLAAGSYASPLQSNLDISSSAETTEHQRMRRSANGQDFNRADLFDI